MTMREQAERLATSVFGALEASPSADQAKKATDMIEQMIIDVVLGERQRCASAVISDGTPDADRAHKLAEDIRRAHDAMIAGRAADTR